MSYIPIYEHLIDNTITLNREFTTEFITELKNYVIDNEITYKTIQILLVAIRLCETKTQLKSLCVYFDYLKMDAEALYMEIVDVYANALSTNNKLFRNLRSIVASNAYIEPILYDKIIEKYVYTYLETLNNTEIRNKEEIQYCYDTLIAIDLINNPTLEAYATQLKTYIDAHAVEEQTVETILEELIVSTEETGAE